MQVTKFALSTMFVMALQAQAFSAPVKTTNTGSAVKTGPFGKDRAYVTADIKTPDPVPEAGQEEALELMKTGRMYRYNVPNAEASVVSKCEKEITDYTGHKYCVALNSCGSALMLLLKTTDLQPGGKVISNAFTFGAVPSAIEHAGGKVRLANVLCHARGVFMSDHVLKNRPCTLSPTMTMSCASTIWRRS